MGRCMGAYAYSLRVGTCARVGKGWRPSTDFVLVSSPTPCWMPPDAIGAKKLGTSEHANPPKKTNTHPKIYHPPGLNGRFAQMCTP